MSEIRLVVNLSPDSSGEKPEVSVGEQFFLSVNARLENRDAGYYISLQDHAVCLDCHNRLVQTYANSMGIGGMECRCSVWECPISMFSGTAYVQSGLRRVRKFTAEEQRARALRAYGLPPEEGKVA